MPIADPIKRAEYQREYRSRPEVKARCAETAKVRYDNGHKEKKKAYDTKRRQDPSFRKMRSEYMLARRLANWSKVKVGELKKRAEALGLPFELTEEDIPLPEFCPVFGTKLVIGIGKQSGDSPSVDRIDNTKGYVKGNVVVVSQRANSLKRDASFSDMQRMVEFYSQFFVQPKE